MQNNHFRNLSFEHVVPDSKHTWINQGENWDDLLPLSNKETKFAESDSENNAIFSLSSLGVSTNRDEWVYDINPEVLGKKVTHFLDVFNRQVGGLTSSNKNEAEDNLDYSIKWSDGLRSQLSRGQKFEYDPDLVVEALYRPYSKQFYYASVSLSDRLTSNHFSIFGQKLDKTNQVISVTFSSQVPFTVQASRYLHSLDYGSRGTQSLPLYRYEKAGNRLENITNWGLKKFQEQYGKIKLRGSFASLGEASDDLEERDITKEDIFHYVYGVLHNPAYRKKYEFNLRREFPRVPFYEDFARWAAWGQKLLELHLNFETVEPYPLTRVDKPNVKNPKAKLRADKAAGEIILDSETILSGVPAAAWEYKLGNRSALEWVLERYKERTPKDKTVAEKFNTYRFADYKEDVIVLLGRVCAVSVQTSAVVAEMVKNGSSD